MKKINLLLLTLLFSLIATGCASEPIDNNSQKQAIETQSEKEKDNSESKYMDALRKCTVMEAADIYTTGIGKKSDNVFNDGRATCESFYKQLGEKDFIDTVNEDWKNRQTEKIDNQPLTHYLDILGW